MRKGKKLTSLLLILVFCLSIMLPNMALAETSDVKGHWAERQLSKWLDLGLVTGYGNGTVKPNNNVTRAEYFTMINKAFGFTEKANISYKDVVSDAWYADQVAQALKVGYISGYEDGTIKPNNLISRQEAAVILAKFLGLDNSQTTNLTMFKDESQIPPWSKGYISAIASEGYLRGYEDKTFKALNPITRAEAITMLDKALGELYQTAGIYGTDEGIATVSGNVTISAQDVTIKNTVIEGNLYITEGVGSGDVTLENIVVKGRTLIKGGGENSIRIVDSTLGEIIINKSNGQVRLVALGDSKIGLVIVNSGAKLEEDGLTGEGFGEVSVIELSANSLIEFDGDFESISIEAQGANVKVAGGTVNHLNLSVQANLQVTGGSVAKLDVAKEAVAAKIDVGEGAKVGSLTANATLTVTGKGAIDEANINSDGVNIEQLPTKINKNPNVKEGTYGGQKASDITSGSSGGGGGSGGSSGSGGSGNSGGSNGGNPGGGGNLPKTLTVTSTAFANGGTIPLEYSRYGANTTLPIKWNQVAGATNYALLMYDEDAANEEFGPFIHWAVTDIKDLNNILSGAKQYTNSFGEKGYGGPQPPPGHEPHTYTIEVYALNGSISLEDAEPGILKADFDEALEGKIVTKTKISGTFALEVLNATLVSTGKVEIKNGEILDGEDIVWTWQYVGKEYKLLYEDQEINIADTNAQSIFIREEELGFYGYQEPNKDSTLWVPLETRAGNYQFFVIDKDAIAYKATLAWEEPEEATVNFLGPDGADAAVNYENGIAIIDFSQVTYDKLHDWSTESAPNYFAIELKIAGVDLSQANVKKAFRVYDDGTIIEPEISGDLDAQYVTTKWKLGYVTMLYVLNDDSIHMAELYVESLTPAIPLVSNVTFVDTDSTSGSIAGTISWVEPDDKALITKYRVYFLDDYNQPIGEPIGEVNVEINFFEIATVIIPANARKLGVVSVSDFGESAVVALSEFDNASGSLPPVITSVGDNDLNEGIDGRDFTVEWTPPTWVYENSFHGIYILPAAKTLTYENLGNYEPVAEVMANETFWTGGQELTKDSAGDDFTEQEYRIWVLTYEESGNWRWLSADRSITPDNDTIPYIVVASTFANNEGKVYSFLVRTNRPINDESFKYQNFIVNGVQATKFSTGNSVNDEWFWIDFEGDYSTGELPQLIVEAGAFQDNSGKSNMELTDVNVTDGAKPVLEEAEVDGKTLTLIFSEGLDEESIPEGSAFLVEVNGTPVAVTEVAVAGNEVTLTLADAQSIDTVIVSYNPLTDAPLQDGSGNEVGKITSAEVTVVTPEPFMEGMFIESGEPLDSPGLTKGEEAEGYIQDHNGEDGLTSEETSQTDPDSSVLPGDEEEAESSTDEENGNGEQEDSNGTGETELNNTEKD